MADWSFYQTHGWSLFPITPQSKRPAVDWKTYQTERAPPDIVQSWSGGPCNTGVATGAISGVIVFDLDSLLARVEAEARGLPVTLTVATPRGLHVYLRHPGWVCPNRARLDGVDGWDVRGDGGYVLGPGSLYVPTSDEETKGKLSGSYAVETNAPIADAPDWLLDLLRPLPFIPSPPAARRDAEETTPYGRRALNDEYSLLAATSTGAISDRLYATSVRIAELVGGGEIRQDEAWGALDEAMQVLGVSGEDKAEDTRQRAWDKGIENPKCAPERAILSVEDRLGTRETVNEQPIEAPAPLAAFGPAAKPAVIGTGDALEYYRGVVYIANRDSMFLPCGVTLGKSAFDGVYGGPRFALDYAGDKIVKSAWQMFRENESLDLPKAFDLCFRPELTAGSVVSIEGLPYLNAYVPVQVARQSGDASPFVDHVRRMLPVGQDAEYLMHWMASAVQNPGAKFQWWPVIQGTKGNGKTLLLSCMFAAIGERYSHLVRADSVLKTGNQFNDWIERKLFLGFEEIRTSDGRRDFTEIMKDSVTNRRIGTEGKNKAQGSVDNRANGMMLTNHRDAVPIDEDERRWGVFYGAQQSLSDLIRDGMDAEYFDRLYTWLRAGGYAIVTDYLATYPLQAALDPARGLQRAPETSSMSEARVESLGMIEQEVLEAIEEHRPGFRGGMVTSTALKTLMVQQRRTVGTKRFRAIMQNCGYVVHEALASNKHRPHNALADTTRPVLYFARGHAALALTSSADIADIANSIISGNTGTTNVVPIRPGM